MLRAEMQGSMVPSLTCLNRAPVSTGDRKRQLSTLFDGMSDNEMEQAIEDLQKRRAAQAALQPTVAPNPRQELVAPNPRQELVAPNPRQELVALGFSPDERLDTVYFPTNIELQAYKHYFEIREHSGSTLDSKGLYVEIKDGPLLGTALRIVRVSTEQCVAFRLPVATGSNPHRYTIYLPLHLLTDKTLTVTRG
jgi:hypothetical protein